MSDSYEDFAGNDWFDVEKTQAMRKANPELYHRLNHAAMEAIAKSRPDLWQKCYPRIYQETMNGDYPSAKEVACDMVGASIKIENGFMGENEKAEIVWASKLAQYRVPIYWMGADITEAIKQTRPQFKVDLRELRLPFEAAVFMLPKGALLHDSDEGEATFISFVRSAELEEIPSLAKRGPRMYVPQRNGVFTVFAHSTAGHLLHWTMPDYEVIDLAHLDELCAKFDHEWNTHRSEWPFYQAKLNSADNHFMARVAHLIFGIVLLMSARPLQVKAASLINRVPAKAGKPPKEFWHPATIGADYKIRKIYFPRGGTHASPVWHWVRGSLKMQAYGKDRKQRKEIWVEPYARGIKKEETDEDIQSKSGKPDAR